MMRKIKTFLLFGSGLIISGLIMETSLQLIERTPLWRSLPVVPPILGQPDLENGYAFTPGASGVWVKENRAYITINSLGLRDREFPIQKPTKTFRIALTGDSQTEALQVDYKHTFKSITENSIRKLDPNVEIVNLASSGNGPLRQLLSIKKYADSLNFNYVISIISFQDFLTKELFSDHVAPAYIQNKAGELIIGFSFRDRKSVKIANTSLGQKLLWLLQNSNIVRLFYWQFREAPVTNHRATKIKTKDLCEKQNLQKHMKLWQDKKPEAHWKRVKKFIKDYRDLLKAHNLKATIMHMGIPIPAQHCKKAISKRKHIAQLIKSTLQRENIIIYDLQKSLYRKMKTNQKLKELYGFKPHIGFGHLNHKGHRIMSDIISIFYKEQIASNNQKEYQKK